MSLLSRVHMNTFLPSTETVFSEHSIFRGGFPTKPVRGKLIHLEKSWISYQTCDFPDVLYEPSYTEIIMQSVIPP